MKSEECNISNYRSHSSHTSRGSKYLQKFDNIQAPKLPSSIKHTANKDEVDPGKLGGMLWNLLKLIFKNMYKDLNTINLSSSTQYIQKLEDYLSHPDLQIRKLSLLVVVVRFKFQKKFRRTWIQTFPHSLRKKRILLGKKWRGSSFDSSSIRSSKLKYTQATLFYSIDNYYRVSDFDEVSLGNIIGSKMLSEVPDPSKNLIWFDRLVNKKIDYSLRGISQK